MKKNLLIFGVLAFVFALASCHRNKNHSTETSTSTNTTSATSTLVSEDVGEILSEYSKLTKYTVIEETNATTQDGATHQAIRTSNVDKSKGYVNSKILYDGEKTGFVKLVNNSYYYQLDDVGHKVNYERSSDAFESVGISKMFRLEYTVKQNVASAFIKDTAVAEKFYNLFLNVNLDLKTDYEFNPLTFLRVYIEFEKKEIQKITFDLGFVYGSFYSSITRDITFVDEDFEYESMDLSSGDKYYVNTADTLDTYVIEMVGEYGDAIYIKSGDFDMLIDSGNSKDAPNVDAMLQEYCLDHKLEMLIATHGHADHIGGFQAGALNSIENVDLIVDYGYTDNDYYERYRTYFNSDYYAAYDCVNFQNGAYKIFNFSSNLSVEILDTGQYAEKNKPLHSDCSDENEHSVVCLLTFGKNTYLYTGDISRNYEDYLRDENIENVTVYKAAHHGAVSNNTNSVSFLNYINPDICVVSASIVDQNNWQSQMHPTKGFVSRILKTDKIRQSKNLYFNGTMGTIHLQDNGIDLPTVTGLGAKRGYYFNGELVSGEDNKKLVDTIFYQNR